ncbi:MAG: radical SAM protein [Chloroflexi bacterium]|nr:radical SAM protein [Chloroflexota bacterium]
MKKVLLIAPPFYRLMGSHFNGLHLGISYIAAVLRQHGYDARIYNADYLNSSKYANQRELFNSFSTYKATLADLSHPIWREIKEKINGFAPDFVGIAMLTANYAATRNIARLVKEIDQGIEVAVGGTHVTLDPEGVMSTDAFDYGIRGEGEFTFLELLCGQDKSTIQGLSFKKDGRIIHNTDRPFIQDLDSLPFPARDVFLNSTEGMEFGNIITGRGCPFTCAYCASPRLWHRQTRFRSIPNVLAELEHIKANYRSTLIHFADDTFTLDKRRTREICQQLIDRGLNINWVCDTRVDRLEEELVILMKQAGCVRIKIGVESGSNRILKRMHKGITTEMVRKAVKLIKKHDVPITAYFLAGFPTETDDDLRQTIDFARELNLDYYSLSIVAPYYGTELWREMEKSGERPDKPHWEYFYHQSQEMILNNNISPGLLEEFFSLNELGKGGRV